MKLLKHSHIVIQLFIYWIYILSANFVADTENDIQEKKLSKTMVSSLDKEMVTYGKIIILGCNSL